MGNPVPDIDKIKPLGDLHMLADDDAGACGRNITKKAIAGKRPVPMDDHAWKQHAFARTRSIYPSHFYVLGYANAGEQSQTD